MSIWLFLLAVRVLAPLFAQTAQPSPPPARVPTRADILRGEYGPYRANNDLLFYHLDVRVDPEKKYLSGKNTIRFKMLQDDTRIQLDLHAALNVDKILLGDTPLKYERDSGAVFVDFPETLRAGQTYTIDFHYSGNPVETGRFGGITFKKDSAGPHLGQHRLRRHRRQRLVAQQGSVARRSRDHGDQRRHSQRSGGCLERQVRRQDGSRRRLHALGLAGAIPHQQLRRLAQHRQLRALVRPPRRPPAGFLRAARRSGKGQEAVRPGQGNARGLPALLRRVSLSRRMATS